MDLSVLRHIQQHGLPVKQDARLLVDCLVTKMKMEPAWLTHAIVDPPWGFHNDVYNGAAAAHYGTLHRDEIGQLEVGKVLHPTDSIILVWSTWPHLMHALNVIRRWGFCPLTIALVWLKYDKKHGLPANGVGKTTRSASEPAILAVRESVKAETAPLLWPTGAFLHLVATLRTEHSAKPAKQYDVMNTLLFRWLAQVQKAAVPLGLELFARNLMPGYISYGNEVGASQVAGMHKFLRPAAAAVTPAEIPRREMCKQIVDTELFQVRPYLPSTKAMLVNINTSADTLEELSRNKCFLAELRNKCMADVAGVIIWVEAHLDVVDDCCRKIFDALGVLYKTCVFVVTDACGRGSIHGGCSEVPWNVVRFGLLATTEQFPSMCNPHHSVSSLVTDPLIKPVATCGPFARALLPEEVYRRINQVFGEHVPKLELYADTARRGWLNYMRTIYVQEKMVDRRFSRAQRCAFYVLLRHVLCSKGKTTKKMANDSLMRAYFPDSVDDFLLTCAHIERVEPELELSAIIRFQRLLHPSREDLQRFGREFVARQCLRAWARGHRLQPRNQ